MNEQPSHPHGHDLEGARAAVATKHHKTATIARALGGPTGLRLQTELVDTDTLGTFTPETPRAGTPREAATAKAQWACRASGLDLGIGSEGSFFPHPEFGFITMQVEYVALTRASTGLTVIGTAIAGAAWTVKRTITTDHDLDEFKLLLSSCGRRLIVRPATSTRTEGDSAGISKGIATTEDLRGAVSHAGGISRTGEVVVESDLRAHYCRPRRELIERAARDLAHRLATRCPRCSSIGYGCDEVRPGAPCARCGAPTATPHQRVYSCPTCRITDLVTIAGSDPADPGTCPDCNP